MTNDQGTFSHKLKTFFISDQHLLHPLNGAAAKQLQIFYGMEAEQIYLVGDIIDFEQILAELHGRGLELKDFPEDIDGLFKLLQQGRDFPDMELHLRFFDALFHKISQGVKVTYLPGNHDACMDSFNGRTHRGIKFMAEDVYEDGEGARFIVEHGHRFDPGFIQNHPKWYRMGGRALDYFLRADHWLNRQLPPSHWLRQKIPLLRRDFLIANAAKRVGKGFISWFEKKAAEKAIGRGMDGIICGHIHHQVFKQVSLSSIFNERAKGGDIGVFRKEIQGVSYINTGDGLTHGTAIGHRADGAWELIGPEHLDRAAAPTPDAPNPYAGHRATTKAFLQESWDACRVWHARELERKRQSEASANQNRPPPAPGREVA